MEKASSLNAAEVNLEDENAGGSASGTRPRTIKPIESGVFSGMSQHVSGDQLVESLQSALSAASRGEAGLSSLHRSLRDGSRALTASRHAHQSLTDELRVMYRGLNEVMSEKAGIERYAALLTQERDAALDAAEEARREAQREREFLLREQDRFIQLLLEEHEAELQRLRGRLSGAPRASDERETSPPPTAVPTRVDDEGEAPTAPRISSSTLARVQLASAASRSGESAAVSTSPSATQESTAAPDNSKRVPSTQRSEAPPFDLMPRGDRAPTYPPPPAVLDLDSLAAEVDGNSERPPPIRRIGLPEPALHLKPARVPSQLMDTLVSNEDGGGSKKNS